MLRGVRLSSALGNWRQDEMIHIKGPAHFKTWESKYTTKQNKYSRGSTGSGTQAIDCK